MFYFRYSFLVLLLAYTQLLFGCNFQPENSHDTIPGSRDYDWTILDQNESISFNQMIGFASNNIWAVNSGDFNRFLWHWNGKGWIAIDCGIAVVGAWSIWGENPEELYIGNLNGELFKYDGKTTQKIAHLTLSGFDFVSILQMNSDGKGNVYIIGAAVNSETNSQNGIIYKFENEVCEFVTLTAENDIMFNTISYDVSEDTFVLIANDSKGLCSAYSFNGQDIVKLIDNGSVGLIELDDEVRIISNSIIYNVKTNVVTEALDLSNYFAPGFGVGRKSNDFFTNTYNGGDGTGAGLSHYNGANLELIYPVQGYFLKMFIFEQEIVCFGSYFSNGNIFTIYGKLQK